MYSGHAMFKQTMHRPYIYNADETQASMNIQISLEHRDNRIFRFYKMTGLNAIIVR